MKACPHPTDKIEAEWHVRAEFSFLVTLHVFAGLLLLGSLFAAAPAEGHPGGLAADGCHNDRKNGGRHCHRGPNAGRTTQPSRSGDVYYPNCAAARAAGAAPVRRGQPGYARHLDRDNDGVGCE
ncbi:excalibur calcium-binding domain-containing protein [Qipengyuania flava]|uniref:excalibur calcium-binding domain-containing protein n=1 Tax=Qipengyuania flava TaxID=192812 RepID=UPI00321B9139